MERLHIIFISESFVFNYPTRRGTGTPHSTQLQPLFWPILSINPPQFALSPPLFSPPLSLPSSSLPFVLPPQLPPLPQPNQLQISAVPPLSPPAILFSPSLFPLFLSPSSIAKGSLAWIICKWSR